MGPAQHPPLFTPQEGSLQEMACVWMWARTEGGTRKGQSQGRVCIEGRGSHTILIIRKKINASVKELAKKAEVKKMS